jgi:hypothetical protein
MSVRRLAAVLLVASALTVHSSASAQVPGGRCALIFDNYPSSRLTSQLAAGGFRNSFVGGGVFARCEGQDVTVKSDSAEVYEGTGLLYLIGNVKYREPRAHLDSRRLTYFINDERLYAEGDVVVTLPSGTVMRGPVVEYFRAVPAVRTQSKMYAPQRSRTTLVQRDTTPGAKQGAADTIVVIADRTTSVADSLVYLSGAVNVDRADIRATSDSGYLDGGKEFAQLLRRAHVVGQGSKSFTLDGRVIDLFSTNKVIRRVVAKADAHATSDAMDITSDTITLDVDSSRVERSRAWGKQRALGVTPTRKILADSLDVRMPRQQVREVHALGAAFAETAPDSLKLVSQERDWVRGDTIVAHFDSVAVGDTAQPKMRDMIATGHASSFYQVPSKESRDAKASLNYVRGKSITVAMIAGEMKQVTVREQAVGVYLEPDSAAAPVKPDTAAATKGSSKTPEKSAPAGKAPAKTTTSPKPSAPVSPADGGRRE